MHASIVFLLALIALVAGQANYLQQTWSSLDCTGDPVSVTVYQYATGCFPLGTVSVLYSCSANMLNSTTYYTAGDCTGASTPPTSMVADGNCQTVDQTKPNYSNYNSSKISCDTTDIPAMYTDVGTGTLYSDDKCANLVLTTKVAILTQPTSDCIMTTDGRNNSIKGTCDAGAPIQTYYSNPDCTGDQLNSTDLSQCTKLAGVALYLKSQCTPQATPPPSTTDSSTSSAPTPSTTDSSTSSAPTPSTTDSSTSSTPTPPPPTTTDSSTSSAPTPTPPATSTSGVASLCASALLLVCVLLF